MVAAAKAFSSAHLSSAEGDTPSFCPRPYWLNGVIAPCLIDPVEASILLLLAVLALTALVKLRKALIVRNEAGRSASEATGRDETQPLIETASGSSASNDVSLNFMKVLSITTLLTLIGSLIIDLFVLLAPADPTNPNHVPRLPQLHRLPARILADTFSTMAWLLVTVAVYLLPTSPRQQRTSLVPLARFWLVALGFSLVQLYQWSAILVNLGREEEETDDVEVERIEEIVWGVLFGLRFVMIASILTVSRVAARAPLHDEEEAGAAEDEAAAAERAKKAKEGTWADAWEKLKKLLPFMWPTEWRLQTLVVASLTCLAAGRVVNVLVPLQYKVVVDILSDPGRDNKGPWIVYVAVLTFCFLRYLQGNSGIVSSIQNLLWIPVGQYNYREISVKILDHLHNLSLQYHINRKTGEVLQVVQRGTSSVAQLLSTLVFNILPIFVDIFISVIVFINYFDLSTGMIVLVTMALYIWCTVVVTEWRTKFRREMNQLDNLSRARAVDSLLNFETVKYYNNEQYEVNRFRESIISYQSADWKSNASLSLLNTCQNTLITLGLTAGAVLVAKRVMEGVFSVGDFVLFFTYALQLYGPLNFFGTYYRVIQQMFVDMENMFELMEQTPDIQDVPGAQILQLTDGSVKFENVSFGYTADQPILKNVSFTVPPRTTTAIVGPTGSGKSTIFRLLFRFYDTTSGKIYIDRQDIRGVTQKSLRKAIGVVPQDTVLFNDTIAYNIAYGDVNCQEDRILSAARRAQIHDRIMTFTDGYSTRVGERGLRLSGGEKQRVAIARTLLKDPAIVLLDEATSALDNTTEALIQRSLKELTDRKTTITIAHRLSTIVDADCILVMKDGRIVEQGRHADLMQRGEEKKARREMAEQRGQVVEEADDGVGTYYAMWMRQLEDEQNGVAIVDAKADEKTLMAVKKGRTDSDNLDAMPDVR
ncbi:ATP-binding cassette sub- B member 6, mitochondrial, partial [Irineochytrium annulatum]